jgi:hypothetical protein
MRSPAAAIAWEFRQRHRWAFIALLVYLSLLAMIKLVVLERAVSIHLDSPESFAFVVVVPLTATLTYFLAVFTYGLDGDIAARQSMYPARMFTRPLTTATLAGLPMLYGAAAMMILWLATRLSALWPSEIAVPIVWPALLAASLLAWTQALTWMPYPLPGLRIIVTVLWLGTIEAIALVALHFQAHESVMVWIVAPQVPLAYLVARFAVARARRGDVPDWRGAFAFRTQVASTQSRRRGHFRSPASAQAWFEWRRNGRSLPAWIAILLPVELALLWGAVDASALVFEVLLIVILTPPFMATFAAATVSKSSPDASASYGVTPFMATRPLTNGELIVAKLRMTVWSTASAWLLVLIAVPLALALSGTSAIVLDRWHDFSEMVGIPRATVALLLVLWGCIASTWKQLVQSLYIGLTGRESLIKGIVFLTLVLLFLVGPLAEWVVDNGHVGELWSALPLIFAVLVCFKMIAATWIGVRVFHGRLVSDRAFVAGAALWSVAVLTLYGVLVWLLDTPHFPHYLLMLLAILMIPLARLSAAPLALASNRHR